MYRQTLYWFLIGFVAIALFGSCGDNSVIGEDPRTGELTPRVIGTCFMHNEECVTPYIDFGPYLHVPPAPTKGGEQTALVPVYVFPSRPASEGGMRHPFDPEGKYRPFRLQNTVFAGEGIVWEMVLVFSGNVTLMAQPEVGTVLWGAGADTTSTNLRDLYSVPFRSEEDILAAAQRGEVIVINTGENTDCPVVEVQDTDIVINLNPQYRLCPAN